MCSRLDHVGLDKWTPACLHRCNRLMTLFSERIPVVKQYMTYSRMTWILEKKNTDVWASGFWTSGSWNFCSLILLVLIFLLVINEKFLLMSLLGPWLRREGWFWIAELTNGERFCQLPLSNLVNFIGGNWIKTERNEPNMPHFSGIKFEGFFLSNKIYVASKQPNPFSLYSIVCMFTSALANICSLSYELEYWLSSNQISKWFPILLSISCY